MARIQSNRGGRTSSRSKNNNPDGRNQYDSGLFGLVRDRPATTAAAAAGAVAAGVFLWSKRAQISDQLSQLSDQIGEWTDNVSSDSAITGATTRTASRRKEAATPVPAAA